MTPILRNPRRSRPRGELLIAVLIAAAILAGLVVALQSLLGDMKKQGLTQNQRLAADFYVAELLEVFRSMTPRRLVTYLATNPVTGATAAANLYPLCAHVNILDRTSDTIVNRDDVAALAPSWLDWPTNLVAGLATFSVRANRFFQVFVVDATTLQINRNYCALTGRNLMPTLVGPVGTPPNVLPFLPNERLMVTVGVTWVSRQKGLQPGAAVVASRVVNSVLIPGPYQ